MAGDLGAMLDGLNLMLTGTGAEGGGLLLDTTEVGAFVGVPANVVGASLVTEGVATTGIGAANLMSGIKQRKEGKHGTFRGRRAKRANDSSFHRVVKNLDLSPEQAQRLHQEISGRNLSFGEIEAEAKAMFGK
jgi:hypothetical protein